MKRASLVGCGEKRACHEAQHDACRNHLWPFAMNRTEASANGTGQHEFNSVSRLVLLCFVAECRARLAPGVVVATLGGACSC